MSSNNNKPILYPNKTLQNTNDREVMNYARPPHIRDSVQYTINTPDGKIYVFLMEKSPGVVEEIDVNIGKAGNAVAAWAFAVKEFINFALAKGTSLVEITSLLSSITSSRSTFLGQGVECRSGPEGLAIALRRYMNSHIKVDNSTFRRPPRFTNRDMR